MYRLTSIDAPVGVSSEKNLRLEWVRTDRGLACRWVDSRTPYHPAAPLALFYAPAGQTRSGPERLTGRLVA